MSHIFDALQTSEAARTGNKQRGSLSVTELLERAELQEIRKRLGDSTGEEWTTQALPSKEGSSTGASICLPAVSIDDEFASQVESHARTSFFEQLGRVEIPPSSCPQLVVFNDEHSPAAEAFRLLAVRLNQLRKRRNLQKLLITSTLPEEGKTLTAANLACALPTRTQEQVLLVDGDLRRASLSQMFELGSSPGLCECLRGENSLASTIFQPQGMEICILPAGKTSANPLELIQSTKMPALVDDLSARFDWIIVDSPPVLPLADTSAWARLIDGILLVTRPGTTKKHSLQAGVKVIEPQKLIGAILNACSSPSAADYAYYGLPNR